jgi:hypothetical protein
VIEVALIAVAIATAQPGIDPELADRYAEDIAAVSPDVETAVALVVTAWGESNFRIAIEKCDCEVWECDDGEAAGLFQLHDRWYAGHEPEEICADNRLSTELAMKALTFYVRVTGTFERAIRAFRGATDPFDEISLRRKHLYEKLLKKAKSSS